MLLRQATRENLTRDVAHHGPAHTIFLGVIFETVLQGRVEHGRVLTVSKFGQDDGGDSLSLGAIVGNVAGRWRIYPQCVETVPIQSGFDYGFCPSVYILTRGV